MVHVHLSTREVFIQLLLSVGHCTSYHGNGGKREIGYGSCSQGIAILDEKNVTMQLCSCNIYVCVYVLQST